MMEPPADRPHRRQNPLTGEWVLVSPHRLLRPWQGKIELTETGVRPTHDPACYLCPGNTRANGEVNPAYPGTFSFQNDFAALLPPHPEDDEAGGGAGGGGTDETGGQRGQVHAWRPASGVCRVVCFSPRHDLTLSRMTAAEIRPVVEEWASQTAELSARPDIANVQVFENRGQQMGCSNPHPHGQVWATAHVPTQVERENARQAAYFRETGRRILDDAMAAELAAGRRTVAVNDHWACWVPFWATWPFETIVAPRRPGVGRLDSLTADERDALASLLRETAARYDNLFETSFPYTMGWHQAPADGRATAHWTLHAHFYPPLLRSATVRKFMVGFEMLAEAQRDLTAETAADRLRAVSAIHHLDRPS